MILCAQQESAVANMKSLDAMLNMVVKRKGGRAVVGQAIEALREVFLAALLPDRKLRFLSQQPLASLPNSREGSAACCTGIWRTASRRGVSSAAVCETIIGQVIRDYCLQQ